MIELIRLITGEEIIAKTHAESENSVEIENPIVIAVQPNEQGQMSANFIPWIQFGDIEDKIVHLNKASITYRVEPAKQFVENYSKMFSEIITPPAGIIT